MRYCVYCGRWFKNKQATRAHLQFCERYTGEERLVPERATERALAGRATDKARKNYMCLRCGTHYAEILDKCTSCDSEGTIK